MQAASRRAGAQLLRRAKHGECRQRPLLGNPSAMRPNILLITADQWRGDSFGAAGHPVLRTPAIDALAVEGVCFLRHYSPAAPCSPGRASPYPGLYQMNPRVLRNGTPLDARHDNLAKALPRQASRPPLIGPPKPAA